MTVQLDKPRPQPTPVSQPFWDALRAGRVALQRCDACMQWVHYPRSRCPHCFASTLSWHDVSGEGCVYTFSVARQATAAPFADEVPQIIGVIELDEGVRLSSTLVGVDPSNVHVGQRVEPVFDHGTDGITLLRYRPRVTARSVWRRAAGGPALEARTIIHIDDAPLAERIPGSVPSPITLRPLTGEGCDLTVLTFSFPPNYVGKVHWHPADTVYVVRRGQFIVEGEGTYEVGDIRWVKAGTAYGPEGAGPAGCEVMLIGAGPFPLPTFDPAVDPPPRPD